MFFTAVAALRASKPKPYCIECGETFDVNGNKLSHYPNHPNCNSSDRNFLLEHYSQKDKTCEFLGERCHTLITKVEEGPPVCMHVPECALFF